MKIRIRDRLLVMLAGLLLMAAAVAVIIVAYFKNEWATTALAFIQVRDLPHMAATIGGAILLLLLGLYCFLMLFRHRKRKDFVLQETEAGEMSISIKAIEGLVQKCIDTHEELRVTSMKLDNSRKGLNVDLRLGTSSDMSIPLAVGSLQKQIKQYVNECSGIAINDVRVQVDTTAAKVKDSVYTVRSAAKEAAEPVTVEVPAIEEAAEETEEKKRPLHQRLFGRKDQPEIVPMPPKAEETAPVEAPEAPAEVPAAPAVEAEPVTEAAPAESVEEVLPAVTEEAPAEENAAEENAPAAEEAPEEVKETETDAAAEEVVEEDEDTSRKNAEAEVDLHAL